MKKSNEQKPNIVHRLLSSTLKFTKEINDHRSKAPDQKLKYEVPKSFLKAVDNARITAGYDILPRLRHRSISPSIYQQISSSSSLSSSSSPHRFHNRHQPRPKISRSSTTNDLHRASTKKIQFRRTPRADHRQQTTTPMFFSSRPPFRMLMNPNFMMMNRSPRPPNIFPLRSPLAMQQPQPIFRMRFR